ncbi:MAG: hypothetical protein EOO43_13640 [Flavobacterium sp.]|nr:MAG: hypothetical protein EOO43_13640 [Flavobacterium sp.]
MYKGIKSLIIIVLLLSSAQYLQAQYDQYQFSHLDINDGLPHNNVNCFYKDNKGFLWLGTFAGLARYDGYSFKVYKHRSKNKSTISDSDVRTINEGPNQQLWIETRAGLDVYNPDTEEFVHDIKPELEKFGISERNVRMVRKGSKGTFWFVSTVTGLYNYNSKTNKSVHISHHLKVDNTVGASPIIDLAEDKNGNAWMIHADGMLEMLSKNTKRIERRIILANKFYDQESDTYRLFIDRQGLIWVYDISTSTGVVSFDPRANAINHIGKSSSYLKLNSDIVTGIVQDKDDNIWIGTDHGGINVINKKNGTVKYILNDENDSKSLSQNSISSIYYDDQKILWVGTFRKGINFYHPGIIKFNLIKDGKE